MNKQEYLKLDYPGRVEWLNKQLKRGKVLDAICKDLEMRKSNLIVPLEKQGYILEGNEFTLNEIPKYTNINDALKELSQKVLDLDAKVRQIEDKVSRKIQSNTIDIDLPESEEGMMSSRVNLEVMRQWREFTSTRKEKAKDLFSMAIWEFMLNHR